MLKDEQVKKQKEGKSVDAYVAYFQQKYGANNSAQAGGANKKYQKEETATKSNSSRCETAKQCSAAMRRSGVNVCQSESEGCEEGRGRELFEEKTKNLTS